MAVISYRMKNIQDNLPKKPAVILQLYELRTDQDRSVRQLHISTRPDGSDASYCTFTLIVAHMASCVKRQHGTLTSTVQLCKSV